MPVAHCRSHSTRSCPRLRPRTEAPGDEPPKVRETPDAPTSLNVVTRLQAPSGDHVFRNQGDRPHAKGPDSWGAGEDADCGRVECIERLGATFNKAGLASSFSNSRAALREWTAVAPRQRGCDTTAKVPLGRRAWRMVPSPLTASVQKPMVLAANALSKDSPSAGSTSIGVRWSVTCPTRTASRLRGRD